MTRRSLYGEPLTVALFVATTTWFGLCVGRYGQEGRSVFSFENDPAWSVFNLLVLPPKGLHDILPHLVRDEKLGNNASVRVLNDRLAAKGVSSAQRNVSAVDMYELWTAREIRNQVRKWADHYPSFVRLSTAQEQYGLPVAGSSDDCPFDDEQDGCLNYILTIQDFEQHPPGSQSSNRLPEVFLSGEVHGDERVGPTAVLQATQLLLDAALCMSKPRMRLQNTSNSTPESHWESEVTFARACRREMMDFGVDEVHLRWLARLVSTRRVVIVPTANALGYFRSEREENGIDPNRDFPYDVLDPVLCMQTVAARTLNEVFRDHMFQLSLTFHGGMEAIGYEWGAPSWEGFKSPDDVAQGQIAHAYSRFAGGWAGTPLYEFAPMNDDVYPVRGGMEDWAYAASWDPERVIRCEPEQYGGYAGVKTEYGNSTHRVFNMLIETSTDKIPDATTLGTSEGVFSGTSVGNGHVTRNVRLALIAIDLVQPYVVVTAVNELVLSDDIVPMEDFSDERLCRSSRMVSVPSSVRRLVVEWKVGGSISVEATKIWFGKWKDIPQAAAFCSQQPSAKEVESMMEEGSPLSDMNGTGWLTPAAATSAFSGSFDLSSFNDGDELIVLVSAEVDQSWATQSSSVGPNLAPQSHIVNARTNPDWKHEHSGKVIEGRKTWFSRPLTIVLGRGLDPSGEVLVETTEVSSRIPGERDPAMHDSNSATSEHLGDIAGSNGTDLWVIVTVVAAACAVGVGGRTVLQRRVRSSNRSRLREFIADENAPSPGLRHKRNGRAYNDVPNHGEVEMV